MVWMYIGGLRRALDGESLTKDDYAEFAPGSTALRLERRKQARERREMFDLKLHETRRIGALIAKEFEGGLTIEELAAKYVLTVPTTRARIESSGVSVAAVHAKRRSEKLGRVLGMYLDSITVKEIASELGIGMGAVTDELRAHGIKSKRDLLDERLRNAVEEYDGENIAEYAKGHDVHSPKLRSMLKANGWAVGPSPSKQEILGWIEAIENGIAVTAIKSRFAVRTMYRYLLLSGVSPYQGQQKDLEHRRHKRRQVAEKKRFAAAERRKYFHDRLRQGLQFYVDGDTAVAAGKKAKTSPAKISELAKECGVWRDPMQLAIERFWARVDKSGACWVWTGSKDQDGYGCSVSRLLGRRAHRASWEIVNGKIPKGMQVLHTCDNPPCVNPDHLFLGTHKINMWDRSKKGRHGKSSRGPLRSEEVLKIRSEYAKGGTSYMKLAQIYDVDKGTIMNCVRRKTYSNI